jgi:type IV secretory pathway VirB10-like protein
MSVLTLPWFEEEDPRDLRRWAIAAAIVFGIHAAAVGGYAFFHQPDEIGDANAPLAIDLAPSDDTIDQPEIAPVPEEQPKQVEEPPPPPEPRCASNRHGRPRWCGTFSNTSAIPAMRNHAARKAWCN